jgi:hypothetical protein
MIQYSPTTRTFYPSTLQYPDLPPDLIIVSKADYDAAQGRPADCTFDFVNGELLITPPDEPSLNEVKAFKLAQLAGDFAQRMGAVKAGYPDDEIQSWFDQKGEAVAYATDKNAATPLLSAMAAARGITVADLAARVIVNAAQYAAAAGMFIGKRQKYEDAVNAAVDVAGVESVLWVD